MDQQLLFEFYLSGVVLNGLCVFGLIANLLTLYVLNASREMRRQPINMFLTVLAIYDKGVLLNAILMCGIPALSKGSSSNNLYSSDSLFNATTMPLAKNLSTSPAVDQLNRTARSAQALLFSDAESAQAENQLWIELIGSSKEDESFSIESQLIANDDPTNSSRSGQSAFSDLLSFSNSTRSSETLIYWTANEAMAQQIDPAYSFSNWTDLSFANSSQPSTFAIAMQRMADFFQGYIRIIYPFANISQTGSIWITCLITGLFTKI